MSPDYTPDPAAVECAARAIKAEDDGRFDRWNRQAEAVIGALVTEGHLVPAADAQRAHSHNHGCVECAAMFGGPEQQGRYGLCADHREQSEAALAEAVALLRRHVPIKTPNWITKQRCACGEEYVSRAELALHRGREIDAFLAAQEGDR